MSTRTNILVETNDGTVYQYYIHYDGYPEGVGCNLVEWLSNAYAARNERRFLTWKAKVEKQEVTPEPTLQEMVFTALKKHYRDNVNAGPGDLLEPEDAYNAGDPTTLHNDIEFLYLIDLRDPNEAVLICRNVRNYDWKRMYLESRQSYRAVICDINVNGSAMASFSYKF